MGAGRLGTAIAAALRASGLAVEGPGRPRRGAAGLRAILLLCVPDAEIGAAAAAVAGAAPFVGHVSGATPLAELAPAARAGAETFGLHPLQTFAPPPASVELAGAGCAVAGTTPEALGLARELAHALGMEPFEIDEAGRAAYHAAASIASNFLLALEAAAERVAAGGRARARSRRARCWPRWCAGRSRTGSRSAPSGRSRDRWRAATTQTVGAQRAAVGGCAPELLALFDSLLERDASARGRAVPA